MPIANYVEYSKRVSAPCCQLPLNKGNTAAVGGRLHSLWTVTLLAGVAPTVPVVPTNLTVGALPFANSGAVQRIARAETANTIGNMIIICDRLSHQAGLNATVITPQTTNLPTAPLTRYTDGVGVMAALEIYTAVGTTATTVTINYTNSAGVAGRVSQLTDFGATNFREALRFILLPLADGDVGVKSVESVTVTAATDTAGNFGVTLFKPLIVFPVPIIAYLLTYDSILGMCGNMPQVLNNACLFAVVNTVSAATGGIIATISIIKE